MDLYSDTAYHVSRIVTRRYSTSFTSSIRLFDPSLRPHIYAIYGLVRIADEIVDTYREADAGKLLDELEHEALRAIETGFSTNPIVHAFALTHRDYSIDNQLIKAFFTSMRMDLTPRIYDKTAYQTYIYGSAEVVGLMCLKVFTNDDSLYNSLVPSAKALGSAYQKVNFLRDIAADNQIGRYYFPKGDFTSFDDTLKQAIITDISRDIAKAKKGITKLPTNCRSAIELSLRYYETLLKKIAVTPAAALKVRRVRLPAIHKLALAGRQLLTRKTGRV